MTHTDATELLAQSPAYEDSHKEIIQDALNALRDASMDEDYKDLIRDQMFA